MLNIFSNLPLTGW